MWLEAIDHVQITGPPESAAALHWFYSQVLELPELEKPVALQANPTVWYQLGEIQLHVSTESTANNVTTRRHICFRVRDLAAFADHLQAQGVEIIPDQQPIPHFPRFYLRDPGGNRIEIAET